MLIDHPAILQVDVVTALVAEVNGNKVVPVKLQRGVYQIGHFGSTAFLEEFNHYPNLESSPYGVCDNVQQILDKYPTLQKSVDRHFLVTLTPVVKANQSAEGGWRWHKWGPYIGTHEIKHEYLYDEEGIEKVFTYHIYELE